MTENEKETQELQRENRISNHKNVKYKDNLFTDLFYSDITAEDNLRELYNALHPEDKLSKEDRIIKKRLEEVFYKLLKNDIAELVKDKVIILGEQQSTINENMPVRLLMYIGRIYEELLEGNNKYKKALIGLPTPEFYVFYTGKEKWAKKELKLSDAFIDRAKLGGLELIVHIINIRIEDNEMNEVLKNCSVLRQYSELLSAYEQFKDELDPIGATLKYCVEHGILVDYLKRKTPEVFGMLMQEYSLEDELRVCREEAREQGLELGIERGIEQGIERGIEQGIERGIEQGIEQGELLHLIKTIYKKMLKGKANEEIADEVEEDIAIIERVKESILEYKKKHKDEEFNASIVMEYFKGKNK